MRVRPPPPLFYGVYKNTHIRKKNHCYTIRLYPFSGSISGTLEIMRVKESKAQQLICSCNAFSFDPNESPVRHLDCHSCSLGSGGGELCSFTMPLRVVVFPNPGLISWQGGGAPPSHRLWDGPPFPGMGWATSHLRHAEQLHEAALQEREAAMREYDRYEACQSGPGEAGAKGTAGKFGSESG